MANGTERGDVQTSQSAVDESLIDEMLALSPRERLRHNDRMLRSIELLREGVAEMTGENGR